MMMDVAARRTDVDFAFVDQGTGAAEVRSFLARHELPTTLVFSPEGALLYRHVGEISRAELERRLDRAVR